mmetsp:Transcript_58392/g.142806  ORF Transcript_58392/g.142806 Transcript_58392/m.142806 type:complete len:912 (-) Transcript_58392:200-2935(-)|eukprot:CAMPEP_0113469332 /NCGR_PEP_ID=MMETSP0014_2-20120614/15840_1 /TAXON_ID=2857 /ORGANISM="Nitzschia sp." /LENGTH=911 /DNA_ID=CAMNT_0000361797 /DNA_START=226 /DNA_END=2961 /DNA_ORIENTATION=+ /assembly_acc=CAM_ASM_000159
MTKDIGYPLDKSVVRFGGSADKVDKPDRAILGGKGLGLQEMGRIGVDVPPGFTLVTPLCRFFHDQDDDLPVEVWDMVWEALANVEKDTGKVFGAEENPLLFSCRSGAAISMPGMMDTVLNIGLNDTTVEALAKATGSPRFAYDSYRRLVDMYGDVVLGMPHEAFEDKMDQLKKKYGVKNDVDFTDEQLKELVQLFKEVYKERGFEFPEDPKQQLKSAIKAVFGSWNSTRAVKYREIKNIKGLIGTACNIQVMVFGNAGNNSGTGVAFSRCPSTGKNEMLGEYLINAQGEDVVAGIRTPEPIATMKKVLPEAYDQFVKNMNLLEKHFGDMQDVEFTVENGKLWMLQCRSGKRTGQAAFQVAMDMVNEGLTTKEDAILRIESDHVRQILHPNFAKEALNSSQYKDNVVAVGLAGGPGAAVGKLIFSTAEAEQRSDEKLILVREVTSPEDVGGMWASQGILTARGGVTSHAAVVARGWGKPCVCGCEDLLIDEGAGTMTIKSTGQVFKEGQMLSINGSTGEVIGCAIPTSSANVEGPFGTVLSWADQVEDSLKVLANADSGPDAAKARELGAQGIGLTRTEHMFFAPSRLPIVRRWILKGEGLDKVQEFQREDFREIFKAMDGLPVTVRLLDPPLHEFLPRPEAVNDDMVKQLGFDSKEELIEAIQSMHEENPMLGLRGCRLAIVREGLSQMQVEAIMSAAADVIDANSKANPRPRIMIPLVGHLAEFKKQAIEVKRTAERVKVDRSMDIKYEIGTMIEVPRAAIISDQLAGLVDPADGKGLCDFFSFGTNDLTQMTHGVSRDDSGIFLSKYVQDGLIESDPFKTIDEDGVGWLVRLSAAKGKKVNPNLSLSVCGEHGGDPDSIQFWDKFLDYVSCSPFRVPVARLAKAQAAITRGRTSSTTKEERVKSFVPAI